MAYRLGGGNWVKGKSLVNSSLFPSSAWSLLPQALFGSTPSQDSSHHQDDISFLGLGNPYQNLHECHWNPGAQGGPIQDMIVTLRASCLEALVKQSLVKLLSFAYEVLLRKFTWHNSY